MNRRTCPRTLAVFASIGIQLLLMARLADAQASAPYTPMPPERARQVIQSQIRAGSIPRPLGGWRIPPDFYVSGASSDESQMVIFAAAQPFTYSYFEPKNLLDLVPTLREAQRSVVAEKVPILTKGLPADHVEKFKHLLVFLLNGVFYTTVDLTPQNAELFTKSETGWERGSKTIRRGGYFWHVSRAGILLATDERKYVALLAVPEGLDKFSYAPPILYQAVLTTTHDGRPSISIGGRTVEFR